MCQESVGGVILDQERASRPVSCSPRLLRVHCVFLNFFYSNSNLNLNFQNILQLHIWMHACFQTACWKVWYVPSGNIWTVWKPSRIFWNYLEIFGLFGLLKLFWNYLEISRQFWNCPEDIKAIRKDPDSLETVRNFLRPSGNIQTVLKPPGRY